MTQKSVSTAFFVAWRNSSCNSRYDLVVDLLHRCLQHVSTTASKLKRLGHPFALSLVRQPEVLKLQR